jgi:hypothetical protein
MTTHPLIPLAERVGCDVPTLMERIAASEELCEYIAHKLTLTLAASAATVLLSPAAPCSPLPCVLYVNGDVAACRYPEINDKLRATVKALGWKWRPAARAWAHMGGRSGPALDRLVEAACALLTAGFVVELPNKEVAQRVCDGNYSPPQEHWIALLTSGEYAGWFYVSWPRNEDLYHAAMRIHGSRYSKPGVACPPESYDEVADFAQLYGYSLTEGAIKLTEKAQARAWEAAVVEQLAVKPRTRLPRAKRFEKPQPMPEAPAQEIDDDLRD